MKTATVQSVCECQAKLGAELDDKRHVIRGSAIDPRRGRREIAPAHSIGAERSKFEVAWFCPFCIRNQVRLFDAAALTYAEPAQPATARPRIRAS